MKLYVVMADAGEYDGHSEWMVKASLNKDDAEAYAKDCNTWFKDNEKELKRRRYTERLLENKLDPQYEFSDWDNGLDYDVEEVEMIEATEK